MEPDTLIGALDAALLRSPERTAVVFRGARMSCTQLGASLLSLAGVYRRYDLGPGDRIVCSVSNRPEHLIALGAAWACGSLHVAADHQFTAPELSRVITLTRAAALVYEPCADAPDRFDTLRALRERHPDLPVIVVTDDPAPDGYLTMSELIGPAIGENGRERPPLEPPSSRDPAIIFISSGTTGMPKATLGYHGNLAQRWQRLAGWLGFRPQDVHLAHLPLSHGFGLMMAIGALLSGGPLILLDRFTAAEALRTIEDEGVTVLNGAPAHFKLLLNQLSREPRDIGTLRLAVGTAASFSPELIRTIWERLGVEFMYMYGSSEGVGVATTDREDMLRGSVGRPSPGSVLVVDGERNALPIGEVGEVAFSRRVYPVRYWGTPEAGTAAEWYYSGDLGRLDEAGRLYILGRLKHQIDRGGLKVDPVEVEAALMRLSEVADAAVIGLPNPVLGETVCACVVPAAEQELGLERLRAALSHELAPYKLPEDLCILARIPRTRIGKVDLALLRAEVAARRQPLTAS